MIQKLCHINLSRGFRGGERQTELLIRGLAQQGITQNALVLRDGALAARLRGVNGLTVRAISPPFLHHARFTQGNLLHVHEARARHMAHLCHRLVGAPYLFTRRVDDQPAERYCTRQSFLCAAKGVAISHAIARTLQRYLPALQLSVIPSAYALLPADASEAKNLRIRFKDRFVIGHLGALIDAHKGQSVLIHAARLLQDRHPNILFVLLGSGRDEFELKRQAEGLGNVSFEGQVDAPENYLAAFDLFAFPSRHEGLGSAVLDAMRAGLAVVASDVDGLPELVCHEQTGFLVEPNAPQALANAIERLYLDTDLRRQCGAAARARAEDFSPARMVESYLDLYRQLALRLAA